MPAAEAADVQDKLMEYASKLRAGNAFKPEDLAGGTDDLSQSEKDILFDWEQKFKMKYKYVGDVVP